jgi:hypothetical protein
MKLTVKSARYIASPAPSSPPPPQPPANPAIPIDAIAASTALSICKAFSLASPETLRELETASATHKRALVGGKWRGAERNRADRKDQGDKESVTSGRRVTTRMMISLRSGRIPENGPRRRSHCSWSVRLVSSAALCALARKVCVANRARGTSPIGLSSAR